MSTATMKTRIIAISKAKASLFRAIDRSHDGLGSRAAAMMAVAFTSASYARVQVP